MRSIRRRLLVSLLLGSTVLVLAVGLGSAAWVARQLEAELDSAMLAKARALLTLTKQEAGQVEIDFADELMPEFEAASEPEYFELWLADGSVIERSRSLGEGDLPRFGELTQVPRFDDGPLPDGRPGRRVTIGFVPQVEADEESETASHPASPPQGLQAAVLAVARSRADLDRSTRRLYASAFGLALLLAVAMGGLVSWAVRSGLSPLGEIGRQVHGLDAETLGRRVELEAPVAELEVVVAQLNALLDRHESALLRERRFSSDVAHELRTPVAELRNLSEVGARWPEDHEAVQSFFADVAGIAQQMQSIVTTLLALSRIEGGLERTVASAVVLSELVEASWEPLALEARDRRLTFEPSAESQTVLGDRDKLGLILANLLGNAVAYSPTGSTIGCLATAQNGELAIEVSNPAPHLSEQDLPRLFERFWRKDPARTGGEHAGLGLALARSTAGLLGLALTASLSEGLLRLRLVGPLARGP